MAASVSEVARFEPVDLAPGHAVASGGNDWNFREVLRMDHLDLRNQRGNDICVQADTSSKIEVCGRVTSRAALYRRAPRNTLRSSEFCLSLPASRLATM